MRTAGVERFDESRPPSLEELAEVLEPSQSTEVSTVRPAPQSTVNMLVVAGGLCFAFVAGAGFVVAIARSKPPAPPVTKAHTVTTAQTVRPVVVISMPDSTPAAIAVPVEQPAAAPSRAVAKRKRAPATTNSPATDSPATNSPATNSPAAPAAAPAEQSSSDEWVDPFDDAEKQPSDEWKDPFAR